MVTFLRYMMHCMVITAKRLAEDKYGKCVFVQRVQAVWSLNRIRKQDQEFQTRFCYLAVTLIEFLLSP